MRESEGANQFFDRMAEVDKTVARALEQLHQDAKKGSMLTARNPWSIAKGTSSGSCDHGEVPKPPSWTPGGWDLAKS